MKKSLLNIILKWLLDICILLFMVIIGRYFVEEITLPNRFSSTVTIQQELPGIPIGSKLTITANGTILIDNKIPTKKQWDTLIKQKNH